MLKKVLYFLLAASLIAMAVFSFAYNAWGNGAFGHSVIRAYSYLHLDLAGRM